MSRKRVLIASGMAVFALLSFSPRLYSADQPAADVSADEWSGGLSSSGERIYYTATSHRGIIRSLGMRGPEGKWINGPVACVSCHSPDGKGGAQKVNVGDGVMQDMDARDIRWKVLADRYTPKSFGEAVMQGKAPDGKQLRPEMPRYRISSRDIADLVKFLETLP